MNFWVHLSLAVLLTAYFAYRFWRDRQIYQLLFVIWVPTTLLTYISTDATFRIVLAVFQVAMFLLVLFFMFRKPKTPLLADGDAPEAPDAEAPGPEPEDGDAEPEEPDEGSAPDGKEDGEPAPAGS